MASIDDFLGSVGESKSILNLSNEKKKRLAVRAENLVAAAGTGAGNISSSGEELALRTDPMAYANLDAQSMLELGNAHLTARKTLNASRDPLQIVGDSANSLASGILGSFAGIGAMGVGVINNKAGAYLADKVNSGTEWAQSLQSDELQNRRAFFGERTAMRSRDNAFQLEQDIAQGQNKILASGKSFLRGAADGAVNLAEDTALAGDALANTAGSFVTGGILGGALKKIGAATLKNIAVDMQRVERAAYPLGIGLQEGGGAYTSTIDDALENGASLEQAGQAGIDTAKMVIPAAILASTVSRAGEHPFTLGSTAKTAAKEILFDEPIEEGLQSAISTAAQNAVIADSGIDPNRRMVSGVGESTSQGVILGAASAGAVKAPHIPAAVAKMAVNGVVAGLGKLADVGEQKQVAVSKSNSDAAVQQVMEENVATVPPAMDKAIAEVTADESISDETKVQAIRVFGDLKNHFLGSSIATEETKVLNNPALKDAVAGTENNFATLHALVNFAADNAKSNPVDANKALEIYFDEINNIRAYAHAYSKDGQIAEDHPARKAVTDAISAFNVIEATHQFKALHAYINNQVQATNGGADFGDVTKNPEAVTAIANMAQIAPESVDRNQVETILKHSKDGLVSLSTSQMMALRHAKTLLDAAATVNPDSAIAKNVLTDVKPPENMPHALSAFAHIKAIKDALVVGDFVTAQHSAKVLGDFTRSQMNKVAALNESLATGKPVPFMTLKSDGTFGPSNEVNKRANTQFMTVHRGNEKSYNFARSVYSEAVTLAELYNAMADNFPELGIKSRPIKTALDPVILGSKSDTTNAAYTPNTAAISAMTDEALNTRIETLQERRMNKSATADELAEFKALDAEMSARETQAAEEADRLENERLAQENIAAEDKWSQDPDPATVIEQKQPETVIQTEPVSIDTPVQAKSVDEPKVKHAVNAVAELHPDLVHAEVNPFYQAFKPKKVDRTGEKYPTHTFEVSGDEVGTFVKDAVLRAVKATTTFGNSKDAVFAFTRLLDTKQGIAAHLWNHLDKLVQRDLKEVVVGKSADLAKRLSTENSTSDASYIMTSPSARITSLLRNTDGKFALDEKLGRLAIAATLDHVVSHMTSDAIINDMDEYLGGYDLNAATLSPELLTFMTTGHDRQTVINAITKNIVAFWGLSANDTAPIGDTFGIPATLAAMIVDGLIEQGMIEEKTQIIDGGNYARMFVNQDKLFHTKEAAKAVSVFGDAISKAVVVEREVEYFVGDEKPPVAQTRMNNRYLKNTKDDKATIEAHSKTEFKFNVAMANHYLSLGEEGVVTLFGEPLTGTKESYNKQHYATLEGKVSTLVGAFKAFTRMGNAAFLANGFTETAFRFAFNMSSVGRLQMLGGYNPQNSKLLREVLIATWGKLDTTTPEGMTAFKIAIGQAMGVKVYKQTWEATAQTITANLEGKYKPVLDLLRAAAQSREDFFETPSGSADVLNAQALRDAFAQADIKTPTPVMLHAMSEWVRLEMADEAGKKEFNTSLYVEADGVTNGPTMAQMLLTVGAFSENWVKNIAKGGITLGSKTTLHEQIGKDDVDLYEAVIATTKKLFPTHIIELIGRVEDKWKGKEKMASALDNTMSLMNAFLPGMKLSAERNTITRYSKEGDLDFVNFTRELAKNPLTVTTYGSGIGGIANKVTTTLLDKIYEMASFAAQTKAANPDAAIQDIWFPNDPEASKKFAQLSNMLNTAVQQNIVDGGKYTYVTKIEPSLALNFSDPHTFQMNPEQFKNLSANIQHTLVKPMVSAIWQNLGDSVEQGVNTLQQATTFMGNAQTILFQKIIADYMEEHGISKGDFLSQKQLEEIYQILRDKVPAISTEHQSFMIGKWQAAPLRDMGYTRVKPLTPRGESKDTSIDYMPALRAPANPGVQGIPMINIGMGDGRMMQWLAQRFAKDGDNRYLLIFDGAHIPLDRLHEMGEMANDAVIEAISDNPFIHLQKAYDQFFENGWKDYEKMLKDWKDYSYLKSHLETVAKSQAYKLAMAKLGSIESVITEAVIPDLIAEATANKNSLNRAFTISQAAKEALGYVDLSVDQMAATESPAVREGAINLDNHLPEAKAEILNSLAKQIVAAQRADAELVAQRDAEKAIEAKLVKLNPTQVMARLGGLTESQSTVLNQFFNRYIKNSGYTFIFGSAEDIAEQRYLLGMSAVPMEDTDKGYIDRANKIIAVIGEPSTETILHEMIHAALGNSLEAYYAGEPVPAHIKTAVQELETIMNDFLANQVDESSLDSLPDFPTKAVMGMADPATKLHEFIAWSLSNPALIEKQKTQSRRMVVDTLMKLTQKVWARIKGMFGIKNLDIVHDQIKLFAGSLADYNKTLVAASESVALKHSPNVAELRKAIEEKFLSMFDEKDITVRDVSHTDINGHVMHIQREVAAAFNIAPQDMLVLGSIVQIFATEAKINTAAVNQINHLYQQVLSKLDQDSFIPADSIDPDADRPASKAKYDILNGRSLTRKDPYGRSSIVPVFLALALVDPQLREILKNMPVPKNTVSQGTFDERASVLGNNLMNTLSARLGGQKTSGNMQQAFDELAAVLNHSLLGESSLVDGASSRYNQVVDAGNDYVVGAFEKVSDKLEGMRNWLHSKPGTVRSVAGNFAHLLSAAMSENKANGFAINIMRSIDSMPKLWKPVHDMINGMVGRTEENASIIDMIKSVRTTVQQVRQMYRDDVPKVIRSQFKQTLTNAQWGALHLGLAKTDLAILMGNWTGKRVRQLLTDDAFRQQTINDLEAKISNRDMRLKAEQLARFMITGDPANFLIPNAQAIVQFFDGKADPELVSTVDQYVSVVAYDMLSKPNKDAVVSLVQSEEAGIDFVLGYLHTMRTNEAEKAPSFGTLNQFKGYVPQVNQANTHMFVGEDTKRSNYEKLGYIRVGNYVPSRYDTGVVSRGYYYTNETFRSPVSQGVMQMARNSVNGVDSVYGLQTGGNAGIITGTKAVAHITQRLSKNKMLNDDGMGLRPIFGPEGNIVAYERMLDPKMKAKLNPSDKMDELLGVWAGRQIEEQMATMTNEALVKELANQWETQTKSGKINNDQFVDLFSGDLTKVQQDMVDLIPMHLRQQIAEHMPEGKFMVRKSLLEDVIGYRNASIGDIFSGSTNLQEKDRKYIENVLVGALGMKAAKKLLTGERILQNTVGAVKHNIVVRSVLVPAMNIVNNMYQLRSVGVPFHVIAKGMPHKLAEIHQYTKSRLEQIDLQTQLDAIKSDPTKSAAIAKLEARIQAIVDGHKRMAIWPLIEAGEFSTVSDVGMTAEDLTLTSGKFDEYIEAKLNKLPPALRTVAQYGWVARNTALYRALQKSVQYGDFIAKAILFDHLTQTEKLSVKDAIGHISEEFVNYDRLPSRSRSYLESIGAIWFFNYKLRIVKSAMRAMRNKPLHLLMAGLMPAPDRVGFPISDNIFSKAWQDTLDSSMGWGMLFRGVMLSPVINVID